MADNLPYYGFRWWKGKVNSNGFPIMETGFLASGHTYTPNGGSACGIRVGDPVRKATTGNFVIADGVEGAGGGLTIYGIVANILQYYDGNELVRGATRIPSGQGVWGTNYEIQTLIQVIPVFGNEFEVDIDDAAAANDTFGELQAMNGHFCDHRLQVAAAGYVTPKIDISVQSTSTQQWTIRGPSPTMQNRDYTGANTKIIVACHEPQTD